MDRSINFELDYEYYFSYYVLLTRPAKITKLSSGKQNPEN